MTSEPTIRVRIAYSPNLAEIGTVVDMPADEAKAKIAEGRVARVDDGEDTGSGPAAPPAAPTPRPAVTSPPVPAVKTGTED